MLNLYIIERRYPVNIHYDEYIGAVVAAHSEEEARGIHPSGNQDAWDTVWDNWIPQDQVCVKYIGVAALDIDVGVVFDSFNAS